MDTFKFSQVVPGTQWSGSKPSQESYVVDKCVFGSGDFSRVYIVTSTRSKKKYAMKMMKRSEDNISEASILLGLNEPRLRHPNHICRLYDIIAMEEYCNYGMIIEKGACSVFDSMHGLLHERHVKRIINQLLLALDTLHAIGIVHADVKPENVLYRPSTRFFAKTIHGKNHFELLNPVIMLCDFNCSKYMPNFGSYAVEVFQTFHYRAPEVTLGQNLSASIDIFSTGAMMVEMLTGEVVFDMDEKDERDPSVPLRKKHMLLLEAEMGDCPQETLAASRFPEFHGALWRADAPRIHDGQSVYREWRRTKEENRNPSDRQLLAVLDSMLTWPTRRVAAEALTRMVYFRQMVVDHPRSHYYAGFEEIDPVQLLTDPVLPEHHPISEGEDGIYQTEEEGGRMVELQQQYQGDSQSEDSQIEVAD